MEGYDIEIIYTSTMTSVVQQAFVDAKARWEAVITNDIPSTYLYKKGASCWRSNTILSEDKVIDDLLIFAGVVTMDGPLGILGSAGPCIVSQNSGEYSRVGLMEFDIDDVEMMVNDGSWEGVILHEMGHILGIGTLWSDFGLIQKPVKGDKNAYFLGAHGVQAQLDIKGTGKPVIETDYGQGTAYGHWDEATYDNELMTGFASGNEKLSLLTIETLQDLGFTVDKTQADAYTIPSATGRRLRSEAVKTRHHLGDDVIHEPIKYDDAIPYPSQ